MNVNKHDMTRMSESLAVITMNINSLTKNMGKLDEIRDKLNDLKIQQMRQEESIKPLLGIPDRVQQLESKCVKYESHVEDDNENIPHRVTVIETNMASYGTRIGNLEDNLKRTAWLIIEKIVTWVMLGGIAYALAKGYVIAS